MIIYPENRSGFDKVFARIHIANSSPKGISDVSTFLILYVFRAKISCHLTRLKVKRRNQQFWSRHTTFKDLSLIWKFWWNWVTMPCSNWLSALQMTKSRSISRSPEAMVAQGRGRPSEVLSRSTLILIRPYSQKKLNRKKLNLALMPIPAKTFFRNLGLGFRFWMTSWLRSLSRIIQTKRVAILHSDFH
jgi:hypothetical protein